MEKYTEVELLEIPQCDFCKLGTKQAVYDGKTGYGCWAYMCQKHFEEFGTGLGLGRGQRLIQRKEGR